MFNLRKSNIIKEVEKELDIVQANILVDLDDLNNVNESEYHYHLGQENALVKILHLLKSPSNNYGKN